MRILVLSFYYPPDLSAGSFRTRVVVDAMLELAPEAQVEVLTTSPNRYGSYDAHAAPVESGTRVTVTRIPVRRHSSGMLDQSRAFIQYARGVRAAIAGRRYDLVFATSSRLMTAVLGSWAASRTGAPAYLDIRDIFAENIREIAARPVAVVAAPLLSRLERWAVNRAAAVNLVSQGFASYFASRYPGRRFSYFTNGIDEEFMPPAAHGRAVERAGRSGDTAIVLYAGNIGEGQGLHSIVPGLAQRMGPRVHFRIIGDGGRRAALERAIREAAVENVEVLDPLRREALLAAYGEADVLFVHLNDYDALRKVLPSKLFEYGAVGKPIWAGVAGFSAEFIEAELENAAVFPPCDVTGGVRAFERLELRHTPRPTFVAKYARSSISRELAREALALATAR